MYNYHVLATYRDSHMAHYGGKVVIVNHVSDTGLQRIM